MKTILTFLSESVVSALGWTLVHSIWQGALIALIAATAWYFLRKHAASLRYNLGVSLLALQVLMSAITFAYYYLASQVSLPANSGLLITQVASASNWQNVGYELSMTQKIQFWLQMHINELVICWFIGAALLMLRFAGGWIYTQHLRTQAHLVMSKEWRTRFGILAAKLNISAAVEFRETTRVITPMVIGAFKPVVLIPLGLLSGFSASQVEAILAHELAHIRRNDYLINMIQSVIEVVYFFHPALWWLSEKVRTEREHCCDDIALAVCEDKMTLAHALVKVAEWQSAPSLAMAFASKKPLLLQRVRRVLGLTPKPVRSFSSLPAMLIVISLVVGMSVYATGQNEKKTEKKSVTKKKSAISVSKSVTDAANTDTLIVKTNEPVEIEEVPTIEFQAPSIEFSINPDVNVSADGNLFKANYSKILTEVQGDVISVATIESRLSEEDYAKVRAKIGELQKRQFDVERYNRELEKIEWAKNKAAQVRADLTERRSGLLHADTKKGQQKLTDTEIEKQLLEFEEKIKAQEQKMVDFNTQLIQTRSEAFKAEQPLRETEKAIEVLEDKMRTIDEQLDAESRKLQALGPPPPPVLRLSKVVRDVPMAPPPPPVEAKPPVKTKKPAPAIAPPPPPVPAKIK